MKGLGNLADTGEAMRRGLKNQMDDPLNGY